MTKTERKAALADGLFKVQNNNDLPKNFDLFKEKMRDLEQMQEKKDRRFLKVFFIWFALGFIVGCAIIFYVKVNS